MRPFIITSVLVFWALFSVAQQEKLLKDDLLKDKDQILAKHFPMINGRFQYKVFAILPEEFLKKLEDFKTEMKIQADHETDMNVKSLMLKDIDFYSRSQLEEYDLRYGLDSIKNGEYVDILFNKSIEPNYNELCEDARLKSYVKSMDAVERKKLRHIIEEKVTFNDEVLYMRSEAYRHWVGMQIYIYGLEKKYKIVAKRKNDYSVYYRTLLDVIRDEVPSGFIKDYLTYENTASFIKSSDDVEAKKNAYQYFISSIKDPYYLKVIEDLYSKELRIAVNAASPDFNCADPNGKMVSLKSLAGKYVYIDVWATWCGPCIMQAPFLTQLEKDYHGKNIHFVSISIDSDKAAWLSFIKSHKMEGIQLLAEKDFHSDFLEKYNCAGVPRFILIDPNGKIISARAEAPSNPELRKKLDVLLK